MLKDFKNMINGVPRSKYQMWQYWLRREKEIMQEQVHLDEELQHACSEKMKFASDKTKKLLDRVYC